MNSYPAELLNHHYACMVVAGITSATSVDDHPTTTFPELTQSLHDILAARGRNVVWDPARGQSAVFHTVFAPNHTIRLPPNKTRPSAKHLASSLADPDAAAAVSPQATTAFAALPPRSPLSPLHPNSALFPDGLIAPIWVRKHTELIPAVFVAFYTLRPSSSSHHADSEGDTLRKADKELIQTIADRKRSLTERGIKLTIVLLTQREMLEDAQLEARLSYIRRSSGLDSRASLFVLTPVSRAELGEFVTSLHSALFESAVDYYREHARRIKRKRARYPPPHSSLLPITNALATLNPNSAPHWLSREGWIVRSEYKLAVFAELQGDNAEALLRYREAYDLLCNSPSCLLGSTLMLPPRSKRWAEAKVLADTLVIKICKLLMYNDEGDAILPTFRRHLARFTDLSTGWGIGTMTFEFWSWLAKQYRMLGELVEQATKVLAGSPLPPFELRHHAPPLPAKLLHPDALSMFASAESSSKGVVLPPLPVGMLTPNQNAVASSVVPFAMLQGPGAYFYLAALCTMERRTRYQRALELSTTIDGPLAHEHKFDHTAQITDHLTKAYDVYKRANMDRTALLVAAKLATTYYDAQKYDLALKFLQRIINSLAKDRAQEGDDANQMQNSSDPVKMALISMAAQCAVECRDVSAALRIALNLVATNNAETNPALHAIQTLLLQPPTQPNDENNETSPSVKVGYGPRSSDVFEIESVFPLGEAECGTPVPFQVQIRNRSTVDLQFLSLRTAKVYLSGADQYQPIEIVLNHTGTELPHSSSVVEVGTLHPISDTSTESQQSIESNANVWRPNALIAFQGTLIPSSAGPIEVSKVVLSSHDATSTDSSSRPELELEFTLADSSASLDTQSSAETSYDALRQGDWLLPRGKLVTVTQRAATGKTLVHPRSYAVTISGPTEPHECYYVDQHIPLTFTVQSDEPSDALECWLNVDLQPTYEGASDDRLSLDPNFNSQIDPDDSANTASTVSNLTQHHQSVHEMELGVIQAGQSQKATFWFVPARKAGLRTLDITLKTRRHKHNTQSMHIVIKTIALDVTAPFETAVYTRPVRDNVNHSVHESSAKAGDSLVEELFGPAPSSVQTESGPKKGSLTNNAEKTLIETQICMIGRASIRVSSIRAGSDALVATGSARACDVMGLWTFGDRFSLRHLWSPASIEEGDGDASLEIIWTALSGSNDAALENITRIPLRVPSKPNAVDGVSNSTILDPGPEKQMVTITLSHAKTMMLHQPSELSLKITNNASTTTTSTVLAKAVSVDLNIDSTENFAFAGSRRLSLPHVLPYSTEKQQSGVGARIVPLKIGVLRLPTFSFRVSIPNPQQDEDSNAGPTQSLVFSSNPAPTQAVVHANLGDAIHVRLVHQIVDSSTGHTLLSTTLYPPPPNGTAPLSVRVQSLSS